MNTPHDKTDACPEIFDVFLCHHNEDKAEIRQIADALIKQGIKPWLDEREIKPGSLWQSALEEQISSIKSTTVFVGESGIGPWQNLEIRAFINEFIERECPVIPAILPSAKSTPSLPILLKNLHYVDFRITDPDPLNQLLWGITGEKHKKPTGSNGGAGDGSTLVPEKEKQGVELKLDRPLETFSPDEQKAFLVAISALLKLPGGVTITAIRTGSTRLFLELSPEDADKIYAAAQNGLLEQLGITEVRIYPSLADPPDVEQRSQLLILLNRVKEFWVDGVFKQSLHHEVLISLGKRAMDESVEPPWNSTLDLPKQRQQLALSNTRIETVFDASGLLLILGEPGCGKTTTLLELLNTLVNRAETSPKERIPVVLNLSSWKKQQTLAEWIAEKMSSAYQVPKKLALNWLDKGYLIPLLDGLDEVKTEQQADCVEAINTYITQFEPPGLVVCCRLMEYQWLPERLKLNSAICIEPLNREQVDDYFAAIGTEFESLRSAIQQDKALQELTQSPLMLNIMGMTYQSAGADSFSDAIESVETRRTQIFAAYVDKMFQRKESLGSVFPKDKVIAWLSWLAKKMTEQSQSVFLVENLQPSWLDNWKQRLAYRGIASLVFGLILWQIFLFIYGLSLEISGDGAIFLGNDLIFGYFGWAIYILAIGLSFISSSSIINGIICWFTVWFIGGFIGVFENALFGDMFVAYGYFSGVCIGLISSVTIGTLNCIRTVETIKWSWKLFLKKFLVLCLLFGSSSLALLVIFISILSFIGEEHSILEFILYSLIMPIIMLLSKIFIGGFYDAIIENKTRPNQGIKFSLINSIYTGYYSGLYAGLVTGLVTGLTVWFITIIEAVEVGLTSWIVIGLIVGLNRGLGDVIKHYALRLVLWRSGKTPRQFIPFLDYCAKLILLKKVGGGYIFIHRMLLEYFAKLGIADGNPTK